MVELEVILGRRGAGKSTLAARRALEASREGALVVVHDPMRTFPDVGEIVSSVSAIRGGSTGKVYIVRSGEPVATVIGVCYQAAGLLPKGVHLTLDEAIMLSTAENPTKLKRLVREIIATARHRQLRLSIVAQAANFIDYQTIALADRLDLFACSDKWNCEKIRAGGAPDAIADRLMMLPDHAYYTGMPGRPAPEWSGPWSTRLAAVQKTS